MDAIAVMAKEPVPGRVKTRLVSHLRPEQASLLYRAFLLDTIETVQSVGTADRFLAFTPESAEEFFRDIVPEGWVLLCQKGLYLGERLANVTQTLFDQGYGRVVILGSDSPDLPAGIIRQAFVDLKRADVIIGPCNDGGYYLIGMRSPVPGIFSGIPWSTPAVMEATMERAALFKVELSLLSPWYDVDTWEDLLHLKDAVIASDQAKQAMCRHTRQVIMELMREGVV